LHIGDSTLTFAYTSFHDLNNQLQPSIIINSITNIAKGTGKDTHHSNNDKEVKYWNADFHSMFLGGISCLYIEAEKCKVTIFHLHQWLHRRASL
jgi:hypothetical protein